MSVILENGTGVAAANSYVPATYVTAYLTDRGRATEGGWTSPEGAEEAAAVVAATDYFENRYGLEVRGVKLYNDVSLARGTLAFTGLPTNGEQVVIGSTTYTFATTVGGANSVLIGSSVAASIDNLVSAILATAADAGAKFGTGTTANTEASALHFYDDQLLAFSKATGTAGNAVATTTTVSTASWASAALSGGSNLPKPQPLAFPRAGLYGDSGAVIYGIPERLKWAICEYAVRARAGTLAPDPTADAYGGIVTGLREKVGPIETSTQYLPGSTSGSRLPSYPAADRLVAEYLTKRGAVRG
jgi:hypothetical protein